jgi:hypothetical protein
LIYIYALGLKPPVYEEKIEDTEPCQFLSQNGCVIERALRPFRCNWYFCDDLLERMGNSAAKPYREFIDSFQEIIGLRKEMFDAFNGVASRHGFNVK